MNILGVKQRLLDVHQDSRGSLTEIYLARQQYGSPIVQWNAVNSEANVLRGVHVHIKHWDQLIVLQGEMHLGLCDLRRNSPTFLQSSMHILTGKIHETWTIPPGIAHGFFFPCPSIFVYGVSEYWNTDDELGCIWNDNALGLAWPIDAPLLSERDQTAPSLAVLLQELSEVYFEIKS